MQKKDDELDLLEENIRKLKNKYDQFFAGIAKVPPMQDRRNVETYIYEIGKQQYEPILAARPELRQALEDAMAARLQAQDETLSASSRSRRRSALRGRRGRP